MRYNMKFLFTFSSFLLFTLIIVNQFGESTSRYCHPAKCPPSTCFCPTTEPVLPSLGQVPQLVMLTFDDGVNGINYETYRSVFNRKHQDTGCPVQSTYFVTHEYTDYHLVHNLWRRGNEIAVHSITHNRDLKSWLNAPVSLWRAEMGGMKKLISYFADIPESEIKGIRVPFLQSAGDHTWQAMTEDGFLYDSSVPVRNFVNPPLYPYTLDMGLVDDCQIEPCPNGRYPGLWEVPMVNWKMYDINLDEDGKPLEVICAMVDACVPNPNTTEWAYRYLMDNFMRHYRSNRAPLPVFMHEFWLLDPHRKEAYFRFIDTLLKMPDVYFTTISEVLDYLKNPVSNDEFKRRINETCIREPRWTSCGEKYGSINCEYNGLPMFKGWPRYMRVCGHDCPPNYPWLNNPLGN